MVSCKTLIANLSNYPDGDTAPEMCEKIEKHLRGCRHRSAVYDSTRKCWSLLETSVSSSCGKIQRAIARLLGSGNLESRSSLTLEKTDSFIKPLLGPTQD
jgi:hypothetical protein